MPSTMFILSAQTRGLAVEIRVNDVRQHISRDGVPARFTGRLNPWLRPGRNDLEVVGRLAAGPSKQGAEDPVAAPTQVAFELTIQHGVQGQQLPEGVYLFHREWTAAELALLPVSGGTQMLAVEFDVGQLPWVNPISDSQPKAFDPKQVLAFVHEYVEALRQRDANAVAVFHQPQFAMMGAALQVDGDELRSNFVKRLLGDWPVEWDSVSERDLALSHEGRGRYARVESSGGGPAIWRRGGSPGSGLRFLLLHSIGRLWVIG